MQSSEIPEFDTWYDGTAYFGRHRRSGIVIEAESVPELQMLAAIERIAAAWRRAWGG
jgi:hypothetical protein